MTKLQELIARQGTELAKLSKDEQRSVLSLYREARGELLQRLESLPSGTFTAQSYRQATVQVEAGIRGLTKELNLRLADTLPRRTGELSSKHLQEQAQYFSRRFRGSIRPIPTSIAHAVDRGRTLLLPQFEQSVDRYGMKLISDIQRRLALSYVSHEPTSVLMDRIFKEYLQPLKSVELAGAQVPVTAYWAERIVRTETIEAYSVAFQAHLLEAHEKEPKLQKQWSAVMEARTCMACAQLDGQTRPVTGTFVVPGTGRTVAGPAAHPNCMCALVAWMPAWNEAKDELKQR